ncbi:unnamed protein product [Peronospora farinosa]|uniref:Serine aminopeptidase S33 domain-containing protein n=1 Tax=Peronospora farinosa TaxID=134698 RepID=A0AAV0SVQ6_9STRA|nr:unnamed protein product [Peronospora farinosa]CAI5708861.1 unnamed protein product [Peronospora farinosa]
MVTRKSVKSALRAHHMPSYLRHVEGTFQNRRGQNLSYLALFPSVETPLRGIVLYLHGIGDHSRRYFYLYERLCNSNFGVLAYDMLSHGMSDLDFHGLRAHSAKFQYFIDDTNEFITMAKMQLYEQLEITYSTDEPKLIISGMSYGTLVSLHTILSGKHDFSGVVLVAPALLAEMTIMLKVQAFFAWPLSKLIPKARIVPGVNRDYVCRDQDYLDDFMADPLTVSEPITARMGAETLKAMRALEVDKRVEDKDSALCKLPLLMMMGSNDKVTSLELAQVFYERLAASEKEFKIFDEYFHALFDDPEHEAVFSHLEDWLKTKFPLRKGASKDDTIDVRETVKTKAEVEKDETKAGAAEASTTVKEKKEDKTCVMEVTDDIVAAFNTSSITDENKAEVVETIEVRKERHKAEVPKTVVVASAETQVEGIHPIAPITDERKVETVEVVEKPVEAQSSQHRRNSSLGSFTEKPNA